MKAESSGLEISVLLNEKEIKELRDGQIQGVMNFDDFLHGKRRQIHISLEVREEQKVFLRVSQYPFKVYLGDAQRISFEINKEFYEILIENGKVGTRYGIGGKFELQKSEDRFINAENY